MPSPSNIAKTLYIFNIFKALCLTLEVEGKSLQVAKQAVPEEAQTSTGDLEPDIGEKYLKNADHV